MLLFKQTKEKSMLTTLNTAGTELIGNELNRVGKVIPHLKQKKLSMDFRGV